MPNNQKIHKVAVIGGVRTPFCRSGTLYKDTSNRTMMGAVLKGLVSKYGLENQQLGEVCLGAVIKHVYDFNLARESTLDSGLSPRTPAYDIQRACGTSLEAVINVANKIALGQIDSGIAGGCDTNSDVPIELHPSFARKIVQSTRAKNWKDYLEIWRSFRVNHLMPNPPGVKEPRTQLSMGESCEVMAKEWQLTQEEQDQLALESHHKGQQAYESKFYEDLIIPFQGVHRDNNLRSDLKIEQLRKLKPCFDFSNKGTLTAGNSTPLTDGASAVLLGSEKWARERKLPILAYITFSAAAAVDFVKEEGLLMAPAYAIPRLLNQSGYQFQDFDFYEIHEAFAAQVLCTLKALNNENFCKSKLGLDQVLGTIDRSRMNVKGGSVALGHPFAATGTRQVATLAKLLHEKGQGKGLISICTAGGMGVTAILEK